MDLRRTVCGSLAPRKGYKCTKPWPHQSDHQAKGYVWAITPSDKLEATEMISELIKHRRYRYVDDDRADLPAGVEPTVIKVGDYL